MIDLLRTDIENMPKDRSLIVLTYYEIKDRFSWWYCYYNFEGQLITEGTGAEWDFTIPETEEIIAWIALPTDKELTAALKNKGEMKDG